jgi:hypothetical protein
MPHTHPEGECAYGARCPEVFHSFMSIRTEEKMMTGKPALPRDMAEPEDDVPINTSSVDRCGRCSVVRRSHDPRDHAFVERMFEDDEPYQVKASEELAGRQRAYAKSYLLECGLNATPDAVDQLVLVFTPCLRIMCERPWDPEGGTWKKSGVLGILTDVRKKFERLWERGWKHGKRHDDSGYDLINFVGMYLRSEDNGWGDWGRPANPEEDR